MTISNRRLTDSPILPFKDIYRGKRIMVTGHTGFKGSWLCIWLKELGADVIGYSLEPPSIPNNFEACNLKSKITNIHGDVRDEEYLISIFEKYSPEFVFHLAAQPLVRFSYKEPKLTYETNVIGTVNVLEAVRKTNSVRSCIIVTSDKCYENREWVYGYRETDPLGGYDPYSSSKGCAELVSQAYIKSFFSQREDIGVASVRAGNVIGGGDWGTDRLLPDCIHALSTDNTILIRNPMAIRPWQFVLEPLYGYLLLAIKLIERPKDYRGAWNFGPNNECCIPVSKMVDKVINYWGPGDWREVSGEYDNKYEMNLLKLNYDKAYSFLKWQGVLSIDSAIEMTVKWYKTFYQSHVPDMYDYCVDQIVEYTKIIAKSYQYDS